MLRAPRIPWYPPGALSTAVLTDRMKKAAFAFYYQQQGWALRHTDHAY